MESIIGEMGRCMIEYIGLIVLAVIICVLFFLLFRVKAFSSDKRDRNGKKDGEKEELGYRSCPLCARLLKKGETVHTVVYGASKANTADSPSERPAEIYGCPYCYPPNRDNPRICPVCKKTVPEDGFVMARMFERPEKRHVHVLGCTGCRGPRRK